MTRENTEALLKHLEGLDIPHHILSEKYAIMQAYVEGKTIQYRHKKSVKGEPSDYEDCEPVWNFKDCHYRVKPQPTCKPYTMPQFLKALIIHADSEDYRVVHKASQRSIQIRDVDLASDDGFVIQLAPDNWVRFIEFADNYEWPDGTPCGKSPNK